MIELNAGIDRLRALVEDRGFDHSGMLVLDGHPPDAITLSLGDGSVWTYTAHRQKDRA